MGGTCFQVPCELKTGMHAIVASALIAAIFGRWEIFLILAVILILFCAKKLPELARGLGEGFDEFRKSCDDVREELDQHAGDAGKSLGGIYGKPAAEALTTDNQVAELYDPAAFRRNREPDSFAKIAANIRSFFSRIARLVSRFLRTLLYSTRKSKSPDAQAMRRNRKSIQKNSE